MSTGAAGFNVVSYRAFNSDADPFQSRAPKRTWRAGRRNPARREDRRGFGQSQSETRKMGHSVARRLDYDSFEPNAKVDPKHSSL